MTPRFRRARASDANAIVAMMRELYEHESIAFVDARARSALAPLLDGDMHGRAWLVEDDTDTPVGYAILTLGYSLEFGGRDAFVDEVFVRESHRHRGIGTRALAVLEEACRELGVAALHLEVERKNSRAQMLYRTQGFEDHDRYLMTKWL